MIRSFVLWLICNVLIVACMQLALFSQLTQPADTGFVRKVLTTEGWATLEWVFVIPAQRIGNTFLSAPQLALSSYVFNFLSQIWSNSFWLHLDTTLDDYVGMGLILLGMVISKAKVID